MPNLIRQAQARGGHAGLPSCQGSEGLPQCCLGRACVAGMSRRGQRRRTMIISGCSGHRQDIAGTPSNLRQVSNHHFPFLARRVKKRHRRCRPAWISRRGLHRWATSGANGKANDRNRPPTSAAGMRPGSIQYRGIPAAIKDIGVRLPHISATTQASRCAMPFHRAVFTRLLRLTGRRSLCQPPRYAPIWGLLVVRP